MPRDRHRPTRAADVRMAITFAVICAFTAHSQAVFGAENLPRQLLDCALVQAQDARLQCYDAMAARVRATPEAAIARSPLAATATPFIASGAQAAQIEIDRNPGYATAHQRRHRFQIGIGYGQGRYDGEINFDLGGTSLSTDTSSVFGGSGYLASASLWRDGINMRVARLSAGLEYLRLRRSSAVDAIAPNGAGVLIEPIRADADVKLTADIAILNLAWLPVSVNGFSPVIGFGLGAGRGRLKIEGQAYSPVFRLENSTQQRFWFPVAQAFAGVNYDLTPSLYLHASTRFLAISGKPFDVDQQYFDLSVNAGPGLRF